MRAVLTAATVVTDDGVHYNTKDVRWITYCHDSN